MLNSLIFASKGTRMRVVAELIVLGALVLYAGASNAAQTTPATVCGEFHVQRNGVEQFCAQCADPRGTTVNYTGTCSSIPPVRLTRATILYPNLGINPPPQRVNVDITQLVNLIGYRTNVGNSPVPWPHVNGASVAVSLLPRNNFICSAFTVPANVRYVGNIGISTYRGVPSGIDLAIQRGSCTGAVVVQRLGVGPGEAGPKYTTQSADSHGRPVGGALLTPGQYYWTAAYHDPATAPVAVGFTNTYGLVP